MIKLPSNYNAKIGELFCFNFLNKHKIYYVLNRNYNLSKHRNKIYLYGKIVFSESQLYKVGELFGFHQDRIYKLNKKEYNEINKLIVFT